MQSISSLRWLTACAFFFVTSSSIMAIEEPDYTVVRTTEVFEIREYEPIVAIETEVETDFEDAGNRAFRRLFNYINGENQSRAEIAMTAPVTQNASESGSEKIAMTAPVTQNERDGKFVVRFVLPATYTLDSAPTPNNPQVKLTELPKRQYAVRRYSGTWWKSNYDANLGELRQALGKDGVSYEDTPIWSRYNAPFTLWFLRRNEIWLPLAN